MSSLSCIQTFFSKMKLVKTFLRTQLKQTNLEKLTSYVNRKSKKGFNDTVFKNTVIWICE